MNAQEWLRRCKRLVEQRKEQKSYLECAVETLFQTDQISTEEYDEWQKKFKAESDAALARLLARNSAYDPKAAMYPNKRAGD